MRESSGDLYPVARRDLAAVDHFGINPAVGVAEMAQQRRRNFEIAQPGRGIHIGGGAADDALDDFQARLADGERLADKF